MNAKIPTLVGFGATLLILTGCFSTEDYSVGPSLKKVEPLTNPSICALLYVTNYGHSGNVTYTTGDTQDHHHYHEVNISSIRLEYDLINSANQLPVKRAVADGAPALYGQTTNLTVTYDPVDRATVTAPYIVGHIKGTVVSAKNGKNYGRSDGGKGDFDHTVSPLNTKYQGDIADKEGVCGMVYFYVLNGWGPGTDTLPTINQQNVVSYNVSYNVVGQVIAEEKLSPAEFRALPVGNSTREKVESEVRYRLRGIREALKEEGTRSFVDVLADTAAVRGVREKQPHETLAYSVARATAKSRLERYGLPRGDVDGLSAKIADHIANLNR